MIFMLNAQSLAKLKKEEQLWVSKPVCSRGNGVEKETPVGLSL